jgi:hypothetical protein
VLNVLDAVRRTSPHNGPHIDRRQPPGPLAAVIACRKSHGRLKTCPFHVVALEDDGDPVSLAGLESGGHAFDAQDAAG